MKALLSFLALAMLASTAAAASDVKVHLSNSVVYQGETAQVDVEVFSSSDPVKHVSLAVPHGFSVEGPFGGMQKTTIVNGQQTTSVEVSFRVTPPANATGRFTIGPLTAIRKSGKKDEIPVGTLTVGQRPKRGVSMTVTAIPPSGPVGMPFTAHYRILYSGRPYESNDPFSASTPFGLRSLSLPILKDSDVRVEPVKDPSGEGLTIRQDQNQSTTLFIVRGGASNKRGTYRTLEFSLEITPLTTGDVDLSALVGLALIDSVENQRDFFGRVVQVPTAHVYNASTGSVVYHVAELPEKGRPGDFTGAVGSYRISTKASPTDVNAYDPIDVTVTVTGKGVLSKIALPRYSDEPAIKKDFEIDSDVDPGKVNGKVKTFHVVFRPRSSAVTALPALTLPYYDPWKKQYVVASSAPIPLTVHDVKTVSADQSVGAPGPASGSAGGSSPSPIAARIGIGANYDSIGPGERSLRARPPLFSLPFVVLLLVPPLAVAAAWLVVALRRRPKNVPKGTALSAALLKLAKATGPDDATDAVAGWLRRRLDLGEGEITTKELRRALAARVVPEETTEKMAKAWDALLAARFAGGNAPEGIPELVREVDACLG